MCYCQGILYQAVTEESRGKSARTGKCENELFIDIPLSNERDNEIYLKYMEFSSCVTVPKFIKFN
jgi:hypothetical protein